MGSFGGQYRSGDRSDQELLAAHVAGDRFAFEELFYRYHNQLFRAARLTSRDPQDAADALQDALLKAHRCAPQFRHDCSVRSWLYRIVINSCVDRLRRNKFRDAERLTEFHHPLGDPIPEVDTAILIERALLGLPVEQRVAVVTVDMEGYSIAETAELLGIPEGTVKSRCARARAKLAQSLAYLDHPADA